MFCPAGDIMNITMPIRATQMTHPMIQKIPVDDEMIPETAPPTESTMDAKPVFSWDTEAAADCVTALTMVFSMSFSVNMFPTAVAVS